MSSLWAEDDDLERETEDGACWTPQPTDQERE